MYTIFLLPFKGSTKTHNKVQLILNLFLSAAAQLCFIKLTWCNLWKIQPEDNVPSPPYQRKHADSVLTESFLPFSVQKKKILTSGRNVILSSKPHFQDQILRFCENKGELEPAGDIGQSKQTFPHVSLKNQLRTQDEAAVKLRGCRTSGGGCSCWSACPPA